MQQSARPGDVLADRYLLVDLLTESGNGRFWRAHDRVLERHVALHCLADDDPLADAMTEAARVSATVPDRRLLRVLDADRRDGVAYVVNEWGSGTSLDILVTGEGPVAPRRAAWMVSEVAAAMAVAHEQRVAHGRLVPENVLIDQTGQVRIIGFCVEAALLGTPPGQVSRDVRDLGGLLYFLLTGRWAGASESAMPPALRDHGRWLRPRQVRAGIPRLLDTLCDQVLNPFHADEPGHAHVNVHTARGLAELLAEYVGDPSGLIQPAPVNGVRGAGVLAVPERRPPGPREPQPEPDAQPQPEPDAQVDAEPTVVVRPDPAPEPEATVTLPTPPLSPDPATEQESSGPAPVSEPPSPVDVPTQAGMPIFDDDADDVSWLEKRRDPPPPPPAFEDPPERPLFAPEPADGGPARRPRPGATPPTTGDYWPWDNTGTGAGTGSGIIPVTEAEPEDDDVPGRSTFRLALLIALSLLLLLAVVVAFNLGRGRTPLGAEPEPRQTPSRSSAPADELTPITGTTASDLDPQGDTPEENPEVAPLAVDGDPATAWRTSEYFDQFGPAGLKTGVGLVIDLGEPREVAQVDLTTIGTPTGVTYYLADEAPTAVAGLTPLAEVEATSTRTRTRFEEPVTGQYLVVWLTSLPAVGDVFQGQVAEVVVSAAGQG